MEGVSVYHMEEYGKEPDIVVEVPQVTTLFGAFSEACKGYSLMGLTDHGMRIAITKRSDNTVHIFNYTRQDKKKFVLSSLKYKKEDKWASAFKAILIALQSADFKLYGMDITIKGHTAASDPYCFSYAVFAGMSYALANLNKEKVDTDRLVKICFSANRFDSRYQARLRDLITIFTVKKDTFVFFNLSNYDYKFVDYPFYNRKEVGTYIVDCAIPFQILAPSVEEFRTESFQAMNNLYSVLENKRVNLFSLSEREIRSLASGLSERERSYCLYIITESILAKKGYEAILKDDYKEYGRLLNLQQRNLINLTELTSPETDWLWKRALEDKKVIGIAQGFVGISGNMFAIIDGIYDVQDNKEKLEEYEHIFGFHPTSRAYLSSDGLRVLE